MEEEAAKLKEMQKEAEDSLMSPSHMSEQYWILYQFVQIYYVVEKICGLWLDDKKDFLIFQEIIGYLCKSLDRVKKTTLGQQKSKNDPDLISVK